MTNPTCHFSIDDVLPALLEATSGPSSPSHHPFFQFLQQLHDTFALDVDLYLFHQLPPPAAERTLADVPDRWRSWFIDRPWLRFGPHAVDNNTLPHTQSPSEQQSFCEAIYRQIERFASPSQTSRWVRLHYFSESYELASYLRSQRVEALLTTDKPAVSYRLPPEQRELLRCQGWVDFAGIRFVRSQVRIETLVERMDRVEDSDAALAACLQELCATHSTPVVFTHEYELVRPEVRDMAVRILRHLVARRSASSGAELA